jgi:hypothetical protein
MKEPFQHSPCKDRELNPGYTEGSAENYIHSGAVVFMAVTMKNAVFWDIKTQFVPDWKHITFPLQSPDG